MFTLLSDWKVIGIGCLLIISLIYNGYQKTQVVQLRNENFVCSANLQNAELNLNALKALSAQQQSQLQIAQQEVAQAQIDSAAKIKQLQDEQIPQNCDEAVRWGIVKAANMPKFIWNNNIP